MKVRLGVLASGSGTNFQALLDLFRDSDAVEVALLISDRADSGALPRAREAGVRAHVVEVHGRPIAGVTADLLDVLESAGVRLVALAGYLRLVPRDVVRAFRNRIVNVHPALLPSFGGQGMYGRRVHEAVLRSGCTVTGATVHLVNEEYDRGRILAQWPVPVLPDDDADRLAARVLRVEHRLYPVVVEWLARLLAAAGGDAEVRPPEPPAALPDPVAYALRDVEAPSADEMRRVLGLS